MFQLFKRFATTCASVLIVLLSIGAKETENSTCYFSATDALKDGSLVKKTPNDSVNNSMVEERRLLLHAFNLFPAFFFIAGRGSTNAYATREIIEDKADGTVAFGVALIQSEVQAGGGKENTVSIPAIMGHEYAHLLQFRSGTAIGGVSAELQADYLAGWYLANRIKGGQLSRSGLRSAIKSFYEKGDYDFNSPLHHGTPEQRAAAVQAGYDNAQLKLQDAYTAGLDFVGVSKSTRTVDPTLGFSIPDFESGLTRILASRDSGFKDLRGTLSPGSTGNFDASFQLPGAKECSVIARNKDQGEYNCTMTSTLDEELASNYWNKLVAEIRTGFANGWQVKIDESASARGMLKEAQFVSSDGQELSMVLAKGVGRQGYRVDISIPFDNY
jgi:hypothetical protein